LFIYYIKDARQKAAKAFHLFQDEVSLAYGTCIIEVKEKTLTEEKTELYTA
jgi:hypothetical protein